MSVWRGIVAAVGVVLALAGGSSANDIEFFEKDVRPVLVKHCYSCHSAEAKKVKGGLLLDTREGVRKGGDTGAVLDAAVEKSLLVRAVKYADPLLQMPPDGKMSEREIAAIVEWVRRGAPDPREGKAAVQEKKGELKGKDWWAFRPVKDHVPPAVRDERWARNEVDRFVLAKLESQGMRPAPVAEKRTLIRRATFDLTGLPPTPEEVEAFLADPSPNAFEKVVERLLASPHYGERWGRHWLDVARYADTAGCNSDFPIADAWKYRNYVIDSFNKDKPYDRFLREQLAGDLLPASTEAQRYEQIIATGYIPLSRRFSSVAEEHHLTLDDTVDNLGKAILGLTVGCARCHDHKFDPISKEDYYALYGIFQSTTYSFPGCEIYRHTQDLVPLWPRERVEAELGEFLRKVKAMDAEILRMYSRSEKLDTGKERDELRSKVKKMQVERDGLMKKLPKVEWAYAATEGMPANSRVHVKGDHKNLGPEVPRGFLSILGGQRVRSGGSGRLELAGWVTDPANPLTARVMVNRIWLNHFGQGIVRTPDDFGTRGAPPTHPELLDWLTKRFVDGGWSVKAMHRRVMLSSAYRMAVVEDAHAAQRDPKNEAMWTFNRRRLSAEEVRDAMLAVSGSLDRTPGEAHPFKPEVEWRYTQHNPFVGDFPTDKRSVYLMQQRFRMQPYLGTFDGADTNAVTGMRRMDTTPQQALFMLNSAFAHQQAARFAERVIKEEATAEGRVRQASVLALGRPATSEEVEEGVAFVREMARQQKNEQMAWASYLRVVLSSNEFVFVE